jgi:ABC-type Zn uptake system ZnuABC Zn-binding protein ZnuA
MRSTSLSNVMIATLLCGMVASPALADEPLAVCATVSDLGNLAREVGGDQVEVTVFVPPKGDPHFVEARPSLIRALSEADLFVVIGLELEVGWAPRLWESARNSKVLPGAPGFVDCSQVIETLDRPAGVVDRTLGDVHPYGNPHYLLDPLNGLRVAGKLRDALIATRPEKEAYFRERFQSFHDRLGVALLGSDVLVKKYDLAKVAVLYERGKLVDFLSSQGEDALLGGWFKQMLPFRGRPIVTDHQLWSYFARRYGLEVVGYMEARPGVPPSTRHLTELVEVMKAREVKLILSEVYYDEQYGRFLNENTGARVLPMAHQVGSRPGTDDYIAACDYNVRQLVEAGQAPDHPR